MSVPPLKKTGGGRGRPDPFLGKGRPKGALNKSTAEMRQYASQYTEEAIECLVGLMRQTRSLSAQGAAAQYLLDRCYGRPAQSVAVAGDAEGPPIRQIIHQYLTTAAPPSEVL